MSHRGSPDLVCVGLPSKEGQRLTAPPNDMRISCGPWCPRPHKPTFLIGAIGGSRPRGAWRHSGPSAACAG